MIETMAHNYSDYAETILIPVPPCDATFDPECLGDRNITFHRARCVASVPLICPVPIPPSLLTPCALLLRSPSCRYDPASGTSNLNPRRQVNGQTHFIDASVIYGATTARMMQLRLFSGGLLLEDPVNGAPLNARGAPMAGPFRNDAQQRLTGDPRGNVNPGLLALQGLFVLEHNRWARLIARKNPTWGDERLFQEARKRVRAIIQAITYNEYLPILLGGPLPAYTGYKPGVDPSADLSFAVAAYRYGHSGINSVYWCVEASGSTCPSGNLLLRDVYFNPEYLHGASIAHFLRGLVLQPEAAVDTSMVDDVRNWVEGTRSDLAARDIMRGRDVGLPLFTQTRVSYGLSPPRTFQELTTDLQVARILEELYGSVDEVDLWVGGLAESAGSETSAAFVSETFREIIRDQFLRSRDGDRFYYENRELGSFVGNEFQRYLTNEEIAEIGSTKLSDVIIRNTAMKAFPRSAFRVPTDASFATFEPAVAADSGAAVFNNDDDPELIAARIAGTVRDDLTTGKRKMVVDPEVMLEWAPPTVTSGAQNLEMTVALRGTGWVGLGFGTGMIGADIIVVRVVNGAGEAVDMHATAYVPPTQDASQDVTVVSATEAGGVTKVSFRRPLATGDPTDTNLATLRASGVAGARPPPVSMIFAWNPDSDQLAYHASNRAIFSVDLFGPLTASNTGAGGSNAVDDGSNNASDDDTPTGNNNNNNNSPTNSSSNSTSLMRTATISSALSLEWKPPADTASASSVLELTGILKGTGWFAIGFGTGMADADVIMMRYANGRPEVTDATSSGYFLPTADASQDVTAVSGSEAGGVTRITIRRALKPNDANDKLISTGLQDMVFAWDTSTDTVGPHGANRVTARIDLLAPPTGDGGGDSVLITGLDAQAARMQQFGFHALSMFAVWGILVPAGVMTVRFFKHKAFWLNFHKWAMMMAATLTIPAAGQALAAGGSGESVAHGFIGVSVAIIIVLQALLGIAIRSWLQSDNSPPVSFYRYRILHRVLGWLLVLFGMTNCYLGVKMLIPSAQYYFIGYFAFIFILYGVLSFQLEMANFRSSQPSAIKKGWNGPKAIRRASIAESEQSLSLSEVRMNVRAGRKWVLLDGWVFDLSDFVQSHPGGAFLIERCVGSDVGQFFYGRESFDERTGKHVHSARAHELLRSKAVGVLKQASQADASITWADRMEESDDFEPWTVVSRTILNPMDPRPVVRLELHHPDAPASQAADWRPSSFGRHVLLRLPRPIASSKSGTITLPSNGVPVPGYMHAAPQGEPTSGALIRTLTFRNGVPTTGPPTVERPYTIVRRSGRAGLDLYIRNYKQGEMSPLIHALRIGDSIDVCGPKGLGLHLDDSQSGVVVGVAIGTCVVTYFDLIQYIVARNEALLRAGRPLPITPWSRKQVEDRRKSASGTTALYGMPPAGLPAYGHVSVPAGTAGAMDWPAVLLPNGTVGSVMPPMHSGTLRTPAGRPPRPEAWGGISSASRSAVTGAVATPALPAMIASTSSTGKGGAGGAGGATAWDRRGHGPTPITGSFSTPTTPYESAASGALPPVHGAFATAGAPTMVPVMSPNGVVVLMPLAPSPATPVPYRGAAGAFLAQAGTVRETTEAEVTEEERGGDDARGRDRGSRSRSKEDSRSRSRRKDSAGGHSDSSDDDCSRSSASDVDDQVSVATGELIALHRDDVSDASERDSDEDRGRDGSESPSRRSAGRKGREARGAARSASSDRRPDAASSAARAASTGAEKRLERGRGTRRRHESEEDSAAERDSVGLPGSVRSGRSPAARSASKEREDAASKLKLSNGIGLSLDGGARAFVYDGDRVGPPKPIRVGEISTTSAKDEAKYRRARRQAQQAAAAAGGRSRLDVEAPVDTWESGVATPKALPPTGLRREASGRTNRSDSTSVDSAVDVAMRPHPQQVLADDGAADDKRYRPRPDLKLVLMACFEEEETAIEYDWLLRIAASCPDIEVHFNVKNIRNPAHPIHQSQNVSSGYLSRERLASLIPPRNLLTVSLCGTSTFIRTMRDTYLSMGLPKGMVSSS